MSDLDWRFTDREALAVFAVAELNMIHRDIDDGEGGCCADCCAPCGVLRTLLDEDRLPGLLADLPSSLRHLAEPYEPLDHDAIRALWRCGDNPPCKTLHDDTEETTP